jgi:hypothetical protein
VSERPFIRALEAWINELEARGAATVSTAELGHKLAELAGVQDELVELERLAEAKQMLQWYARLFPTSRAKTMDQTLLDESAEAYVKATEPPAI